jgi:hypothetical protein
MGLLGFTMSIFLNLWPYQGRAPSRPSYANFEIFRKFLEICGRMSAAEGVNMEKIIDSIVSAACVLLMVSGGTLALKKSFLCVQQQALTKATLGLPALAPFTRGLAETKK